MDKRTGIETLRLLVKNFNGCREDFVARFTVAELVKLHEAWLFSRCGISPDKWAEEQVREALVGIAPDWDREERPVYSDNRWTARLVPDRTVV